MQMLGTGGKQLWIHYILMYNLGKEGRKKWHNFDKSLLNGTLLLAFEVIDNSMYNYNYNNLLFNTTGKKQQYYTLRVKNTNKSISIL